MKHRSFITFNIDNIVYAVDVCFVKEIKIFTDTSLLTIESPEFVLGITEYRQKITPIINLQALFHKSSSNNFNYIIYVENKNEMTGLVVSELPDLIQIDKDHISDKSETRQLSEFTEITGLVKGVEYHIINIQKLLTTSTLSIEQEKLSINHER